jgi:hypothetical protein
MSVNIVDRRAEKKMLIKRFLEKNFYIGKVALYRSFEACGFEFNVEVKCQPAFKAQISDSKQMRSKYY